MNMEKANWHSDGDSLKLSMPIAKVDKERRIVSGFATLDNVDQHGDIVDSEASTKAFENFRGNIREMHQPLAVGKMLSFRKEKFFDPKTGKEHSGVFVNVYVSKGAQDTWEKVLDGTLSGFSIGGNIKKSDNKYDDEMEKSIRVIKEYDLTELSLVDNPANQLSNILSIQKTNDGMVMKGMVAEATVENVFYCSTDDMTITDSVDSKTCPSCEHNMENIGWIESNDTEKSAAISNLLAVFKNNDNNQGGVEMGTKPEELSTETSEIVEKSAEIDEVQVEEQIEKSEDPETVEVPEEIPTEDPAVEDEVAVTDVEVEEVDFVKMLDEIKSFFSTEISKAATAESVNGLSSRVESVTELANRVEQKLSEVSSKYEELENSLADIRNTMAGVSKRVDGIEGDTAFKKSSDLDGSDVKIQKSKWGGHFLSVRNL